jgi:hypothetical protein
VIVAANVDHLDAMADALSALGVTEWHWIRFKPVGRGTVDAAPSPAQLDGLWPRLLEIEGRTGLSIRVDCALAPLVLGASPAPDPVALRRLGVTGCAGGHSLWARDTDGTFAPCSYAASQRDRPPRADRARHRLAPGSDAAPLARPARHRALRELPRARRLPWRLPRGGAGPARRRDGARPRLPAGARMGQLRSALRLGVVAALAACTFVVSYVIQRLAAGSGVDPQQVIATVHIPYFDRLRVALLHATAVGALVMMGLDEASLDRAARALPWLVGATTLAAIAAAVWMP